MDFSFSPEQDQLRAHARSFLEKRRAGASWPELARLGWTGASIPEAQGGAGLSFIEEAIVFEELGLHRDARDRGGGGSASGRRSLAPTW